MLIACASELAPILVRSSMKRYHVFAYPEYYPGGGWSDHVGSTDDREEAIGQADALLSRYTGGVEVIDLETEEDIYVYPKYREALP